MQHNINNNHNNNNKQQQQQKRNQLVVALSQIAYIIITIDYYCSIQFD